MTQLDLCPLVLDFETFYDKDYSLKKISVIEYVMRPEFEVICFSYKEVGGSSKWFTGSFLQVKQKLVELCLYRRRVIAHNAFFEAAIVEWKFGLSVGEWFCTMMGARPLIVPFHGSATLATCAEAVGLPDKGFEVKEFIGKRRADFSQGEMQRYGLYCMRDSDLEEGVYKYEIKHLPDDEVELINLTIQKFVAGRLQLDVARLQQARKNLDIDEAKVLLSVEALGLKKIDITSNLRFAQALQKFGVDTLPMKLSPTTGHETYAFAKRDPGLMALRNHPDPNVQLLIESRLLLKSSIDRTRIDEFLNISQYVNFLPVPLLYFGAHTGRFSGLMGINLQNLPKGSELRHAIVAPPGYKLIVADLSSIEARITAVLAGQWDLVKAFADGVDVYSEFATDLYGYPVSDCDETADERFVGKFSILGLGFGMGEDKFDLTLQGFGRSLPREFIAKTVQTYRSRFTAIPRLWRRMDANLARMMELAKGAYYSFPEKYAVGEAVPCVRFTKGKVTLPNGMSMFYPGLTRNSENKLQYRAFGPSLTPYLKSIWGGTLLENIVQALARIVLSRAELRLARAGLKAVLQVHDELVYMVPDAAVEKVVEVVRMALVDPVPWMPELPLACKVGVGQSYGSAKT